LDKENQNINNEVEKERNNPENISKDLSAKLNSANSNKRAKKSIIKKLFKYFLWIDTAIFILLISFIILLQTTFFKTWILHFAVNKINKSLASKESYIFAESLEGNIITNLKLNNAYIVVKNDTLIKLKSIKLNHKFFRLFDKVIDIDNLEIEEPQINLTKVFTEQDTLWNFEYLFKPEIPEVDTTKKEFDWNIFVANADINNFSVRSLALNSTNKSLRESEVQNKEQFDINDVFISDINFNFNGKYTSDNKLLTVNKLTFNINSLFNLKNLSFNSEINSNTRLENLSLKTTRTDIEINKLVVDNFTPFDGINLDLLTDKNFSLKINCKNIDFADIKYFVPDFDFIKGNYEVAFDASGKYNDFLINNLYINNINNKINLAGRVTNLDSIEDIYLNINLVNSEIDPVNIKENLKDIGLPDVNGLGKISANIKFEGGFKRFYTKFDLNSSAGSAEGDARIDLYHSNPIYKASGIVKNLNIAKITGDPKNNFLINSEFNIDGIGLDYKTMTARLNYNLTNSTIINQKIIKSAGEIRLNRSLLDLDLVYISNIGSVNIKGNVDFRNFSDIKYDLKGSTQNLNLSAITPDLETSDLNFEYDVKGTGFDLEEITSRGKFNPDKLNGEFKFNLANSVFGEHLIPATPIIAIVNSNGQAKDIFVASDFIDLTCSGNFDFQTIPVVLTSSINNITKKFNERLEVNKELTVNSSAGESDILSDNNSKDTLQKNNADDYQIKTSLKVNTSVNFKYNILIKSLLPLQIIMKDSSISFTGLIKGEVKQTENIFAFSSEGKIENFRYRDSVLRILKTNFTFDLTDINEKNDYRDIYANLYLNSNDIYRENEKYDGLYIQFNTIDTNNLIAIRGKIDSNISFYTKGKTNITKGEYNFFIDSLNLSYFNYRFLNPEDLLFSYKPSTDTSLYNDILFKKFTLEDNNQKIDISGRYSIDGNSDLNIAASKISINKLLNHIYNNEEDLIQGNVRKLYLNYTGTLESPNLSIAMTTDPLSISEFKLGRIDAIINYENSIAKSQIGFFNPNNEGKLSIDGTLPIKNPFSAKEKSDQDILQKEEKSFLESEVNMTIIADNYQTKIFEKFIPSISELDAKVNSNINLKGKIINPEITGEAKIKKGAFKFNLTNVKYNFDATLTASGQRAFLNYFRLFYPADESRAINSTGYIDLSNLNFNEIDLTFTGDVKVLTPDITKNELGIYGDLVAGAGEYPIRLKGNSDSISLTGTFALKKGKIYIPSLKSDAYSLYTDNINYKILIDSTSIQLDSIQNYILLPDTTGKHKISILDPYDYHLFKPKDTTETKVKAKGNFIFDVNIVSENKIFLRFIVDEQTRQEFMGEISLKLYADNRQKNEIEVRGNIDIDENSIYKFYKNFAATGNIKFTGDVSDPSLNIKAEYSGSSYSQELQITRNVVVQLLVLGKLKQPEFKWRVLVDDTPISGDPTDEAISFLLFGKLKSELNASQRLSLVSNIGANIGTVFLSSYLNQFISTYLPFILSTDINYVETQSGSLAESTDIRFTAGLGDATIRFGGQILTDLSNTNFLLEYPLNKLFKIKSVSNNLIFKFERIIDPYSQNTTTTTTNNRTGASLIYRIKF